MGTTFNRILITGGCGFIGSHFVRMALKRWPDAQILNLDLLTYAGNLANLHDCADHPNYTFVRGDVRDLNVVTQLIESGCDAVVHLAAESHVDRSILASDDFMTTNILGTHVLLEAARKFEVPRFLYVSTDEVYGSLEAPHSATEDFALEPNSPYSVSKTAADMLVRSYFVTYGFPGVITRASNNFGPYQYPEKLIPLFVTNLIEGRKVPLYGDGLNVRDWIYVEDHCEGIARVLEDGQPGEAYNIGGGNPRTNREIADKLVAALADPSMIEYVQDRSGHDRRYAIESDKMKDQLGWQPRNDFDTALQKTIAWYKENRPWWEAVKTGAYRAYYEQQYGQRDVLSSQADRQK